MNEELEGLTWDEELCLTTWQPQPELVEDVFYLMAKQNPYLIEMMDKFKLEIEN